MLRNLIRKTCALFLSMALLLLLSGCTINISLGGDKPEAQQAPSAASEERGEPQAQDAPQSAQQSNGRPVSYTHESAAFSIDFPPDFSIGEEGELYAYGSRADHATLGVIYDTYEWDVPLYSVDDLGDNREHCAAALWDSYGATAHSIDHADSIPISTGSAPTA